MCSINFTEGELEQMQRVIITIQCERRGDDTLINSNQLEVTQPDSQNENKQDGMMHIMTYITTQQMTL